MQVDNNLFSLNVTIGGNLIMEVNVHRTKRHCGGMYVASENASRKSKRQRQTSFAFCEEPTKAFIILYAFVQRHIFIRRSSKSWCTRTWCRAQYVVQIMCVCVCVWVGRWKVDIEFSFVTGYCWRRTFSRAMYGLVTRVRGNHMKMDNQTDLNARVYIIRPLDSETSSQTPKYREPSLIEFLFRRYGASASIGLRLVCGCGFFVVVVVENFKIKCVPTINKDKDADSFCWNHLRFRTKPVGSLILN